MKDGPNERHQAQINLANYKRKLSRLERELIQQRQKVISQKELIDLLIAEEES